MDPDVQAVLFDAGGVLLMPDPAAFRARLAPFGVEPDDEACWRAHFVGMAEIDRIGRTDYLEADRAIVQWLGVSPSEVDGAAAAINLVYTEDAGVPVPGVADQLMLLQRAGIRLAIVSNATGRVAAQLAEHRICSTDASDCASVDVVIDSAVVGVEKPDPAIFALALEALDLRAEDCVYVGDSVHFDINGARAAGLAAVHVAPHGCCAAADHPHVASVEHFAELLLTGRAARVAHSG